MYIPGGVGVCVHEIASVYKQKYTVYLVTKVHMVHFENVFMFCKVFGK